MRECSYLNCIQGQDLWVLLAPFGSDPLESAMSAFVSSGSDPVHE